MLALQVYCWVAILSSFSTEWSDKNYNANVFHLCFCIGVLLVTFIV